MARLLILFLVVAGAGCAASEERPGKWAEERRASQVRITRVESAVQGCRSVGIVSDDDWDDLRKKAARLGGDTAFVMTQQPVSDKWLPVIRTVFTSEVFRCQE